MNDREFDALLESAAPELPPDDVARDVTPWRRAIGNILGGSAMCSITLNFFCLNYLLPTIGVILQLLGFRPLRRENRWFRACWLLAVLRAALFLPCIVLNATIYSNAVYASSVGTALTYAMLAVQMLLFFCFWQALRTMQKKAGTGGAPPPQPRCSSGMQRSSRWPMSSTAVCCSALRCSAAIFSFCAASSVSPVRWRRAATRSRPRRCVSRTRCWSGPSRRCSPPASPAAISSSQLSHGLAAKERPSQR